jgi:hypothetical protein
MAKGTTSKQKGRRQGGGAKKREVFAGNWLPMTVNRVIGKS